VPPRATLSARRLQHAESKLDVDVGAQITRDNVEKRACRIRSRLLRPRSDGTSCNDSGIIAEHVRDLMVATVEHRYGQVNRVPEPIEWLTDSGSYTARTTRVFARGIGLIP
jgi:putative transposase